MGGHCTLQLWFNGYTEMHINDVQLKALTKTWMICEVDIRPVFDIGVVLAKQNSMFLYCFEWFSNAFWNANFSEKWGLNERGQLLPATRKSAPAVSSWWHLVSEINWPANTCYKQSKTPGCWYWHVVVNKLHLLENTCDPEILAFPRLNQLRHPFGTSTYTILMEI